MGTKWRWNDCTWSIYFAVLPHRHLSPILKLPCWRWKLSHSWQLQTFIDNRDAWDIGTMPKHLKPLGLHTLYICEDILDHWLFRSILCTSFDSAKKNLRSGAETSFIMCRALILCRKTYRRELIEVVAFDRKVFSRSLVLCFLHEKRWNTIAEETSPFDRHMLQIVLVLERNKNCFPPAVLLDFYSVCARTRFWRQICIEDEGTAVAAESKSSLSASRIIIVRLQLLRSKASVR